MTRQRAVTVLAGGVGAAKFLRGLIRVVDPAALTIVVNTADDDDFYGLAVSPDLDTVLYTLAGVANPRTGWGRAGDTFRCLEALERLYGPAWFHLGDRDLATHLYRTERRGRGTTLTTITRELSAAFEIDARILPMTNDRVRTVLETGAGRLPFQQYLIQHRARPRVNAVHYRGAAGARPAPGVLRSLQRAAAVIIAPSNPFLSIGPILAVPGIRQALTARRRPVLAVSPLVGGRPVSGPLGRLLRRFRLPASSVGIARCYAPFLDALLIDRRDRRDAPALEEMGCRPVIGDTVFTRPAQSARAARQLLAELDA